MTIQEAIRWYQPIIQIGKIRIGRCHAGGFWLEHDSGEGAQVSEAQMAKMMEKVFRELM